MACLLCFSFCFDLPHFLVMFNLTHNWPLAVFKALLKAQRTHRDLFICPNQAHYLKILAHSSFRRQSTLSNGKRRGGQLAAHADDDKSLSILTNVTNVALDWGAHFIRHTHIQACIQFTYGQSSPSSNWPLPGNISAAAKPTNHLETTFCELSSQQRERKRQREN